MATGLHLKHSKNKRPLCILSKTFLSALGLSFVTYFIFGFKITSLTSLLVNQYFDSSGRTVTGPLNLAAAVNDAGSQSLNLTTTAHKKIIVDAVNSGYLSPINRIDSNGIYIIMGGPDVKDAEFCTANCGYNSYDNDFQYMFIGYPGICPNRYTYT